MNLNPVFDSIVRNTSEARKCYELGMFAESAQFFSMIQHETGYCINALSQASDTQGPVAEPANIAPLSTQTRFHSGETSVEGSGSATRGNESPQTFPEVSPGSLKRKPSERKHQTTRKPSRPSSPGVQRQAPQVKSDPSTPPSSYYQTDTTTPQHPLQPSLIQPQSIVASQNLPPGLQLLQSQTTPFMNTQVPQSPFAGYSGMTNTVFRSHPAGPYFPPGTLGAPSQIYQSPPMDFTRQPQLQTANPLNLVDPRPIQAAQFRRPSETALPKQPQIPLTTSAAPTSPTINLPGHVTSFPAPSPTSSTSGEAPFPAHLLPRLDTLFLAFLQKVLSDESMSDSRGEPLHHPLPPRKQHKIQSLPLSSWRPVKLRIQAFTAAFQEELASSLAVGMNMARHEVSVKRVREYLWTKDLIARYNPSGRKAKSRGSHVWCVEARRRADDPNAEWEFRHWRRKIQVIRDSLIVPWGQHLRFPFKVWDPQVQYEGQLPPWIGWESESILSGAAPASPDNEGYKVLITLSATYTAFGMKHVIESRMELDVRPPGSHVGDLAFQSSTTVQPGAAHNSGMDTSLESYLDEDEDDVAVVGQNAFSSGNTTPQSAVTPSMANPSQILYLPSQSLQKQALGAPTPPPVSGPAMATMSLNQGPPLTPTVSPAQFNTHIVPRPPSSGLQTPLGGPLHFTEVPHDPSFPPSQQNTMQSMGNFESQSTLHLDHAGIPGSGLRAFHLDALNDSYGTGSGHFEESYSMELE